MHANLRKHVCWYSVLTVVLVLISINVEAGLLSGLIKLGQKVDVPDTPHLSSFRFAGDLAHYPEGSVAEISFNSIQNKWLAKTPDGKSVSVDQFTADVSGANKQATLFLSERNLPNSLEALNSLPSDAVINIRSHKGKTFSFIAHPSESKIIDRNISVAVSDIASLKTVLWQLQRPVTSSKIRLVQLADSAEVVLAKQNYGSKLVVDEVGVNKVIDAISSMRQQTLIISAKINNGVLIQGKHKIALADLEAAAAKRDVNLIVLESDKPKKTLLQLAKDWQLKQNSDVLLSYSSGDFFNAFSPKNVSDVVPIEIAPSGQLRTALHFEQTKSEKAIEIESKGLDLSLLPLRVLTNSVTLYQPNEARTKELDRRIDPRLPSWVHITLLFSFVMGIVAVHASWFLYQKLWRSPNKANYKNWFLFILAYVVHRLSFVLFYLPLLGFLSPIYLIVTWTLKIIQFLVIRPARWFFSKVM